jgi:hypothetical protein
MEVDPERFQMLQMSPRYKMPMAYNHQTNQSRVRCKSPSLYQNQTSLHQTSQQTKQQIQPIYTSNANTNINQDDILLQNNIPSCGLRDNGFSWYSDEDISEIDQ